MDLEEFKAVLDSHNILNHFQNQDILLNVHVFRSNTRTSEMYLLYYNSMLARFSHVCLLLINGL